MTQAPEREVVARECRFATFCASRDSSPDMHVIKERVHYADGSSEPNLRFVKDFQRPFYLRKKGRRDYKDFKEWDDLDNLDRYMTRQSDLIYNVARALGKPQFRGGLKDLCADPYIFGVDISSTAIIKHGYQAKWSKVTPYTNAVYDTETDVVHGTGEILMATVSHKQTVYTAIKKSFVEGWSNPIERIKELAKQYLGPVLEKRQITLDIVLVNSEIEVVEYTIAKSHELKPDFLSMWNIEFDINKIEAACNRAGVSMADLLSDPSVPKQYRHYKAKIGPAKKVMASGRILNFKPSQRWHSFSVPASFCLIDAMQVYRQVRQGAPEEPSYALEYMLQKHLKLGKLKFPDLEAAGVPTDNGLEWHRVMQAQFPLHYVVYNMFDCISMEMLDEKTLDLALSMPMFAGSTDFANFNSLPRKIMNELHWFCEKHGKVPGSTASEIAGELDEETTDVKGWIVMLPSHLVADNGLCLIEENPKLKTNVRGFVADLDVAGAYPHNELVFNVSKETTKKELVEVEGVDEMLVRMETINFSAGKTNALEFTQVMYKLPTLTELLAHYDRATSTEPTPLQTHLHDLVEQGVLSPNAAITGEHVDVSIVGEVTAPDIFMEDLPS